MPLFFEVEDGDYAVVKLEVTDDGALVFLNYDIEHDIVLAEMGEEKTQAVDLLESWEERPIHTLFMLQGAKYDRKLYAPVAKKWILDATLLLARHKCIDREVEKTITGYIKKGNFEDRFEDIVYESQGYLRGSPVWSSALTDAVIKYSSAVKSGFDYENDLFTIKFDIERAIAFCNTLTLEEGRSEFKHGMLLTVIQTMKAHR